MSCSTVSILEAEKAPVGKGEVILTFDDGPVGKVSEEILDVLQKHEVKATFCYIGHNVDQHPQVVKRAFDEGHEIALHTYSHSFKSLMNKDQLREENERLVQTLREINPDYIPRYFRPPLGLKTPAVRSNLKSTPLEYAHVSFFYNDTKISDAKNGDQLMTKIKHAIDKNNGGALVLHEMRYKANSDQSRYTKDWLPAALEDLIIWAKGKGYRFVAYP